jgi:hypothetical protein
MSAARTWRAQNKNEDKRVKRFIFSSIWSDTLTERSTSYELTFSEHGRLLNYFLMRKLNQRKNNFPHKLVEDSFMLDYERDQISDRNDSMDQKTTKSNFNYLKPALRCCE